MSERNFEQLLHDWRNSAQLDRNKSAEMQERMNRGEVVTVTCSSGPYIDLRETCADEASAIRERALKAIEEAGVLLAEEEIACGMKHRKTFAKLNELREQVLGSAPEPSGGEK